MNDTALPSPAAGDVSARIWGREVRFRITNPEDLIQSAHAQGRFYEPEELEIIRQYCRFGSVFADIGANIGNHSLFVGLFLHPAQIIPFEVNPKAIDILTVNLSRNGLQDLCDTRHLGIGLSDSARAGVSLIQPDQNMGGSRITDAPGTLSLKSGDEMLAGRRVDFLKIDVEGMEMAVLGGLRETLATWKPRIFIEVDNVNADAFAAWLRSSGYKAVDSFQRYAANVNYMLVSDQDEALVARDAVQRRLAHKRRLRAEAAGKGALA